MLYFLFTFVVFSSSKYAISNDSPTSAFELGVCYFSSTNTYIKFIETPTNGLQFFKSNDCSTLTPTEDQTITNDFTFSDTLPTHNFVMNSYGASENCELSDFTARPTTLLFTSGCNSYDEASISLTKNDQQFIYRTFLVTDCTGDAKTSLTFEKGKCQKDSLGNYVVISEIVQPPIPQNVLYALLESEGDTLLYLVDKCHMTTSGKFVKFEKYEKIVLIKSGNSCDLLTEDLDQTPISKTTFLEEFPLNYVVKNNYLGVDNCMQTNVEIFPAIQLYSTRCATTGSTSSRVRRDGYTFVFETFSSVDCSGVSTTSTVQNEGICTSGVLYAEAVFQSAIGEDKKFVSVRDNKYLFIYFALEKCVYSGNNVYMKVSRKSTIVEISTGSLCNSLSRSEFQGELSAYNFIDSLPPFQVAKNIYYDKQDCLLSDTIATTKLLLEQMSCTSTPINSYKYSLDGSTYTVLQYTSSDCTGEVNTTNIDRGECVQLVPSGDYMTLSHRSERTISLLSRYALQTTSSGIFVYQIGHTQATFDNGYCKTEFFNRIILFSKGDALDELSEYTDDDFYGSLTFVSELPVFDFVENYYGQIENCKSENFVSQGILLLTTDCKNMETSSMRYTKSGDIYTMTLYSALNCQGTETIENYNEGECTQKTENHRTLFFTQVSKNVLLGDEKYGYTTITPKTVFELGKCYYDGNNKYFEFALKHNLAVYQTGSSCDLLETSDSTDTYPLVEFSKHLPSIFYAEFGYGKSANCTFSDEEGLPKITVYESSCTVIGETSIKITKGEGSFVVEKYTTNNCEGDISEATTFQIGKCSLLKEDNYGRVSDSFDIPKEPESSSETPNNLACVVFMTMTLFTCLLL
ncbi:hypothetical protein EIN_314740 [Entamoeba invadens IP1]|uniref:Uncharacterized protein n=1 Tax=Entamoeba invadens IP1 TaxID=370355 RepID=A0A0A1TZ97_ENTIV|nr:hypothetical protein EIN_314740 [Entamoeba invadens IP1]ELP86915.1 hypothetical protein EIN_314740 [Entamoeba invadens IP1]|eukprot:XP_004253686.1 hypothetical protein EIN_314740 [Entamoeba invadens IP1]